MTKYHGKCGCGDVEYTFDGEPINTAFCYCRTCQQHTGSDKWFGVWIPLDKFQFTKGNPGTYARKGDSGEEVKHCFCPNCCTTLCVEVTVASFYSVGVSTLLEPNTFEPNMALYTSHAPKWAVFPQGLPKFDLLPPELAG